MKRIAVMLLVLTALTGCIKSVRLNDRAVVQAAGIDRLRDGQYKVTLEIASIPAGKPVESVAGGKSSIVEEQGETLTDAFGRAAEKQGKEIFIGSAKLIVIGAETAADGIGEILDFFNANHQVTPSIMVALSDVTASELLSVQKDTPELNTNYLTDMLQGAQNRGYALKSRLIDIVSTVNSEQSAGSLTLLTLKKPEMTMSSVANKEESPKDSGEVSSKSESQSQTTQETASIEIAGTAVFAGVYYDKFLGMEETRGVAWLKNEIETTSLSVSHADFGRVSAMTSTQKAKIKADVAADNPVFDIEVEIRSNAQEIALKEGLQLSGLEKQYAEGLQDRFVKNEIEKALAASVREGYDVLGLSLLMKQHYPDFYQANQNNWNEVLASSGFNVSVHCEIERSGADNQLL